MGSTAHAKGNQQVKLNNILFVDLPPSLLEREVEKIGLYDPYHKKFSNEPLLPRYMDVVVVLFSLPLANSDSAENSTSNVPIWEDRASDLKKGESVSFARIAGRCLGGVVTGADGELQVLGSRRVSTFYVDRAEPGDSGTLLFSFDKIGTAKVLGIFTGLMPKPPNFKHARRGTATSIPSFGQLTWLSVSKKEITTVALLAEKNGGSLTGDVTTFQKGVQVQLPRPAKPLFGIFVDTKQPITYIGLVDMKASDQGDDVGNNKKPPGK